MHLPRFSIGGKIDLIVNQIESQVKQPAASSSLIGLDILIFTAALLLYTITIFHGPGGAESPGDAAKFQYIGFILGVPHTPCYPLYVMLTAAWDRIPVFLDTATNVSFFSVLCASAALVFLRRALKHAGLTIAASLAAVVMMAVCNVFWLRATEAGPGAFSFLLVIILLCCVLRWIRYRDAVSLYAGLVSLGIAAGHDPVCMWYVIPVILFIIILQPEVVKTNGFWTAAIAGVVIGFGVYAYVYTRSHIGASVTEYVHQDTSVSRVIQAAFNAQFWSNYFFAGPKELLLTRIPELPVHIYRQLHGVAAVLALPGLFILWRRSKPAALFTALMTLTSIAAVIHLFVLDRAGMYWPVYILCIIWAGCALDWFCRKNRIYGIIACSSAVLITLFAGHTALGGFFNRENPYNTEELFLAMSPGSVLIADDLYAWQEIHNYYRFTDPYIGKRAIQVHTAMQGADKTPHYFISPTVKEQLDRHGISYVPVYSNEHAVLYIIGSRDATTKL
jgi:hypothetical protein